LVETFALALLLTKESIIEKIYSSEDLPQPLFAEEGEFLLLGKGGWEGLFRLMWLLHLSDPAGVLHSVIFAPQNYPGVNISKCY